MHLRSFQANVRVFYPNGAPGGGVPLVVPLIPDGLTGAGVTEVRYES